MRVALVSTRLVTDDIYTREQSAALVALGHDVTVIGPSSLRSDWSLHPAVEHVSMDWSVDLEGVVRRLTERKPDIVHAYETRGIGSLLRTVPVPTVVEVRSVALRTAPLRALGLVRLGAEVRRAAAVGASHLRLANWLPFVDFTAPAGWSTWTQLARERRAPVRGRILYQGTAGSVRRLDRLLQAFDHVARGDEHAHFVLALRLPPGVSPESAVDVPPAIASRTTIVQPRGPGELADEMARAHVAVSYVPSSHGMRWQPPLKVLDAVAAGVVAVASDTPATRHVAPKGHVTIAPEEPAAFARALLEALARPPEPLVPPRDWYERRNWVTIMRDVWTPAYAAALTGRN